MAAPPPERPRLPTTELTPHPSEMPFVPPANNQAAYIFEIEGVPPGYVSIHTPFPSAEFLILTHMPSIASMIKISIQIH